MMCPAGTEPRPPTAVSDSQLIRLVVLVRPSQPKGSDRAHHQPRIDRAKVIVVNAQGGHLGRRIVMDQEIGPGYQAGKQSLVLAEVERTAALVGVQVEKESASLRINVSLREWPSLAGMVPNR